MNAHIQSALDELNADRQTAAKQKARDCLNRIVLQQFIIKTANAEIAKAKTDLAAITVEPLDASALT
jgi:hypothetical protein